MNKAKGRRRRAVAIVTIAILLLLCLMPTFSAPLSGDNYTDDADPAALSWQIEALNEEICNMIIERNSLLRRQSELLRGANR